MLKTALSTVSLLALIGCGGASTSVQQPFSSRGFANETSVTAPPGGATVTIRQTPRLLSDNGQNLRLVAQDVVISSRRVDDVVFFDLEIDGETYALEQVDDNPLFQRSVADGSSIILEPFQFAKNVGLSNLYVSVFDENDEEYLNDGWVVYGLDTDPVEVAAQEGAATFSGVVEATLRRPNFEASFGTGPIALRADFDGNTIGGTAVVGDAQDGQATFTFDPIFVDFEDAAITGNAFSGDIAIQSGSFDPAISGASYQGNLFAIDAASVGGTAQAVLTAPNSDDETFMTLGFVANRADN